MVGTINLALTQQLDQYGEPLSGGQLYIIQAGTISTPQNPYQDTGLTIPMPNPIPLDSAGRIPMFYLADGQIKVRLQDVSGVVKFTADNLMVIGPSVGGGGGGGGAVDPTTILSTGDIKVRYDNAILSGWVRCNGKTIGSASSGATELANSTAQALFQFLWGVDTTLAVSGGRGASAAADWTANKQLTLPDCRGRILTALSDMGNTDVGLFPGVVFGKGNQTTLGSYCGAAMRSIPIGALPSHQHGAYAKTTENPHTHGLPSGYYLHNGLVYNYYAGGAQGGPGAAVNVASALTGISVAVGSTPGASDNQTALTGAGGTMDATNPMLLITIYLKL